MRNKIFIFIFSMLIIFSCTALVIFKNISHEKAYAEIIQDGNIIKTIDLNQSEPMEFSITNSDGGTNTLLLKDGEISVVDANCPDKLCVKTGGIKTSVYPIVCLPNKLVIKIVNADNINSVTDSVDNINGMH